MNKLYFFLLICLPLTAFAQLRNYSNEFLNIGVGAKAFGMGNAVTAHAKDVNAAYWNPAGLVNIGDKWQATAMHASYFQSIANYDYIGVAIPMKNRATLGFSVTRFGVDDIINTTRLIDSQGNIDYNNLSLFNTADYAAQASFAGYFFGVEGLSLGANAKFIYRHIGPFATAFGFGMDAGLQYNQRNFTIGAMVRDITTTFNAWSINEEELNTIELDGQILNELPEETIELTKPKLNIGVAQLFDLNNEIEIIGTFDLNIKFAETNDLVSTDFMSLSPALGVEANYDKMVYLRAGLNNFQQIENFDGEKEIQFQPNIGVGFEYRGISIDYALTDIGDQSIALYSNIFSIRLDMAEFY